MIGQEIGKGGTITVSMPTISSKAKDLDSKNQKADGGDSSEPNESSKSVDFTFEVKKRRRTESPLALSEVVMAK